MCFIAYKEDLNMRVSNIENNYSSQKLSFQSTIVPNKTIEKVIDKAIKDTRGDWHGLGEDNKNLLTCLKGIINDGKNDIVEFCEDEKGIAYINVNGKKQNGLKFLSNYIYTKTIGKTDKKYDGHGTFEQAIEYATKEKGVKLPYVPHQKSAVILKEDKILVLHELNKLRALSPTYDMFFVQVENMLFHMKFNVRYQLGRDLEYLKKAIMGKSL